MALVEDKFPTGWVLPAFYSIHTAVPQVVEEEKADKEMPGTRKAFTGQGF